MESNIILITGATGGIGKVTAQALAQQGHTVVLHGRSREKTEAVRAEIEAATGNHRLDTLVADLFSLADVQRMAAAFRQKYDRLDVLINNAGAMMGKERSTTPEGLEKTLVVNFLAPFLLTELLLEPLAKSPAGRVVNVVSEMHRRGGKPDFQDFQLTNSYSVGRAYGLAKLYNIWTTRHLAARLQQQGLGRITVNALHPGMIDTNFGLDHDKGFFNNLIFKLAQPFMVTPEKGAATTLHVATSAEGGRLTGQYFKDEKPGKADDKHHSPANEQRVWDYAMQTVQPYLGK